jgi:hypothetical protein
MISLIDVDMFVVRVNALTGELSALFLHADLRMNFLASNFCRIHQSELAVEAI